MTGRPIQVETGYGERLPSIDTRIPRMRESDSVIKVKLFPGFGLCFHVGGTCAVWSLDYMSVVLIHD
jgi:hypothetical protein